jgi:hypothetical protein
VTAFNEKNKNSVADEPAAQNQLELHLARALWTWFESPKSDIWNLGAATKECASLIENFLEVAINLRQPSRGNWWCDGILNLSLRQSRSTTIKAVGATIWAEEQGPFLLAPFECEFFFAMPQATEFERAIVRFGVADHDDDIIRMPYNQRSPEKIVMDRPTDNSDWAIAIEIT